MPKLGLSNQKTGNMRRKGILVFIGKYIAMHGYPPTIREVAASEDISVSTALHWLRKLRDEGKVTWCENVSRTLRLVS